VQSQNELKTANRCLRTRKSSRCLSVVDFWTSPSIGEESSPVRRLLHEKIVIESTSQRRLCKSICGGWKQAAATGRRPATVLSRKCSSLSRTRHVPPPFCLPADARLPPLRNRMPLHRCHVTIHNLAAIYSTFAAQLYVLIHWHLCTRYTRFL